MKKGNVLMLAYIVFIFISVYARSAIELSMWNKYVFAVTFTGWVFALADILSSGSDAFKKLFETFSPTYEDGLSEIRSIKSLYEKRNVKESNDGQFNEIIKCEERCLSIQKTINRYKKGSKTLRVMSLIVVFISFLLFFCIIFFEKMYMCLLKFQDGFTLCSFAAMLLVQLLRNIFDNYYDNKIKNEKENIEEIFDNWKKLKESLEMEDKPNAD